jgi:multidrug resistance protein MdtO
MSPADFLRAELDWTPARRILTIRLFITLMVICMVSVTLRPPSVVALSFSFVMMLGPLMMDYTMTLVTAWQLLKLECAAIVLSVVSLAMWGDQPLFLVPWSYGLITLLLFYSRVTGTPTIPAMLYVFAVLYHPEQPDQDIYGALWLFPTLGLLAFGTSIAAQLILWPQDPDKLLRQLLTQRLAAIGRMLERLAEHDKVSEFGFHPKTDERPSPGGVSRQFNLLAHAELAHPALRAKHAEWIDFIVEIDTWFNVASKLDRIMFETHPKPAFSRQDRARLRAIALECRGLMDNFQAPGTPVKELPLYFKEEGSQQTAYSKPVTLYLHRLEDATIGVNQALAALHGPETPPDTAESKPERTGSEASLPFWLPQKYWVDNRDALHYGMKFALGAMICLFMVQTLDWQGIDTAILTCVVVAQSSLGADYRKSVMRIMGASLGGLLAYGFIIVLQPALDTIAGFLLAIAPVCWLSAWAGSGSPRIAYIGTQIGYSFAHAVLPGYGPVTDLETARDRVLGILVGITVVGVIDYLLWPQRSDRMLPSRLAKTLHTLSQFLRHGTASAPTTQTSAALMKTIDSALLKALNLLDNAQIEPGSAQPEAEAKRDTMGLVIDTMHTIARVIQARHRYYANEAFRSQTEALHDQEDTLDQSFSQVLLGLADSFNGKPATPRPSSRDALLQLEDSAYRLMIDPAINWQTVKSIHACIALDQTLLDYIEELESLVESLVEAIPLSLCAEKS